MTAGFTWQPEIGPSTYAMAISVRPNASPVMSTAAATLPPERNPNTRKPNTNVATPTPKKTYSSVPRNSAPNRRAITNPRLTCPAMSWPIPPR